MIDLRSDTVTRPTPAMRKAMAAAEVGDDVYGEDPTVKKLEAVCAEMAGMEAAMFVPTGTMGNQAALRCIAPASTEVICEADCHIMKYEAGGAAALSGITLRTVRGEKGIFTAEIMEAVLQGWNYDDSSATSAVVIENTSNRGGGTVWPLEAVQSLARRARQHKLKVHTDGARIWNAMSATKIPLSQWAAETDTMSACFSKGLGAPVGSIVLGSAEIIRQARRARKMLGGGMRQSGLLAAAALHALEHHLPRLHEDHEKTRMLADALRGHGAIAIEDDPPETNMLFVRIRQDAGGDGDGYGTSDDFSDRCRQRGVAFGSLGNGRYRMVVHQDVAEDDIKTAARILTEETEKLLALPG